MTYKVGQLVYFGDGYQKGVGKVVVVDDGYDVVNYLVHSTQTIDGHDGKGYVKKQDNDNNWWFSEKHLKPFVKRVGQKYKVIYTEEDGDDNSEIGDIVTLISIYNGNISFYESEERRYLMRDLDNQYCEVEFYADVEDAKEQKENKMFTKEDLKAGYLVRIRDGRFAHVVNTPSGKLHLNFEEGHIHLSEYKDDLIIYPSEDRFDRYTIVEVYGYAPLGYKAHMFEAMDRELLWQRVEDAAKEVTIEDIEKQLGYKIKVVA